MAARSQTSEEKWQDEVQSEHVQNVAAVSCTKTTTLNRSLTGSCGKVIYDIRYFFLPIAPTLEHRVDFSVS
jgi:hypothetical protein